MISEGEYMAALRIVVGYHQQVGLTSVLAKKTIFDVEVGDKIKCIRVKRENMALTLTKGGIYTVLNRKDNYIWVRDDKGRSKRYDLIVECWALPD